MTWHCAAAGEAMQLGEIADAAAGSTVATDELLRQLKVVARRTELPPLAEWVDHELTGYPATTPLPTYRGPFEVPVYGQYSGPAGSGASGIPIPPVAFIDDVRDHLFKIQIHEGLAGIQEIAARSDELLHVPWSGDAIAGIQYYLKPGVQLVSGMMTLVGAHQAVPRNAFTNAVAAIRNRVLDLALELEQIHPDVAAPAKPVERQHQAQVVNAVIYGNATIGTTEFSELANLPVPTSLDDLLARLRAAGLDERALDELKQSIADDKTSDKPRIGSRVAAWLGQHANSAVESGAKEGGRELAAASGAFVGQLVRGFLTPLTY